MDSYDINDLVGSKDQFSDLEQLLHAWLEGIHPCMWYQPQMCIHSGRARDLAKEVRRMIDEEGKR